MPQREDTKMIQDDATMTIREARKARHAMRPKVRAQSKGARTRDRAALRAWEGSQD